jgi:glucose repression regulatory protein TUP1
MFARDREHRAGSSRVLELLDALKAEVDTLTHECGLHKMQREELERKLQQQVQELASMQQVVFELERTHSKLKQQ